MASAKHHVTIKGVKDGLIFLLDDTCGFEALLSELRNKLTKTHQKILTGPEIQVQVKLGKRHVSEQQKREILGIIGNRGNLLVRSIESEEPPKTKLNRNGHLKIMKVIVRSGQTLHHDGDILLLGDVNPGGTITAAGDIYILGSLKGMAHAGISGNEQAIVVASHMKPTQLRIAGIISRPPDEWGIEKETFMEFAYLHEGQMNIDKIVHIQRVRPDALEL